MGVPHFAAKFFAGLAQLALGVLPGAAEVFPSLPTGASEVFMRPPDFVLDSPGFGMQSQIFYSELFTPYESAGERPVQPLDRSPA